MELNWLAFAVPLFVTIMIVEYRFMQRQKKNSHSFQESVANLNVGIAERLADLFTAGLFYYIFNFLYHNFAILDIKANAFTWIALFLATDLVWYWYHRFAHKVNIFWGFHVVHHQSEDFNYTTSVRITVLQAFARGLFWCVLPVIGFPPAMITVLLLIHGAYPFFTHTEAIGKLGILEYFLVTPSHHRVHHSSNPEYLDKNYGDVLIIWDKLFGTFAEEKAPPVYGLTKPLESYSFLWQHFHFLLEMSVAFRRAAGFRQKWKILFGKPDDIDAGIRSELEARLLQQRNKGVLSGHLKKIISIQTIVTLVILFLVLLFEHVLSGWSAGLFALFIIVSLINTGAMLEQKKWVVYLDYIRLNLAGAIIYSLYPGNWILRFMIIVNIAVIVFYKTLKERYVHYLYPIQT